MYVLHDFIIEAGHNHLEPILLRFHLDQLLRTRPDSVHLLGIRVSFMGLHISLHIRPHYMAIIIIPLRGRTVAVLMGHLILHLAPT